jgi:hypothetical protein
MAVYPLFALAAWGLAEGLSGVLSLAALWVVRAGLALMFAAAVYWLELKRTRLA